MIACRICGEAALDELPELPAIARVTSDARPWPAGGRLAACRACGTLQKPNDPSWQKDCAEIYSHYELYAHAAGGVEQAVFEPGSGLSATRSEKLLEQVATCVTLAPEGRLLDIGCGNGAFLRTFHARSPRWELHGTDVQGTHRKDVVPITGERGFHQTEPDQVPGAFDVISMLHVLEHIPSPAEFLAKLRAKLKPGGRLLIEVPDHAKNPVDLAVADHASHFSKATLGALLTRAGYAIEKLVEGWIPRELTALAVPGDARGPIATSVDDTLRAARPAVRWLADTAAHARELAARAPIAIFGSSIAATWLAGQLEGRVVAFVDEDPSRAGMRHMGIPIGPPERARAGVPIYIALPRAQAEGVYERLAAKHGARRFVLPPRVEG